MYVCVCVRVFVCAVVSFAGVSCSRLVCDTLSVDGPKEWVGGLILPAHLHLVLARAHVVQILTGWIRTAQKNNVQVAEDGVLGVKHSASSYSSSR